MMKTICLQTSCYERDYSLLLADGLLDNFVSRFTEIDFAEKTIIINNVKNPQKIINLIVRKYPSFSYYFSNDNKQDLLNSFGLTSNDISIGFYYSIQHFSGIFHTNCDYLFHISEDNNIDQLNSCFVKECLDILESNDQYICAMPRWGEDPTKGASEEAIKSDENFYVELGFTDQIYILKVKEFKNKIYNLSHPDSSRYPQYGGESFEKRVNSFMHTNGKYRVVHKNFYYIPGYYDYLIKKSKKPSYFRNIVQKFINVKNRIFK